MFARLVYKEAYGYKKAFNCLNLFPFLKGKARNVTMKHSVLLLILFTAFFSRAYAQSLSGSSTEKSGTTTSSSFVTVNNDALVSLDVSNVSRVMVVATFSSRTASGAAEGYFRIADNSSPDVINSGVIQRTQNGYWGMGSMVHIFDVSSLSGTRTYAFQHRTSTGQLETSVQFTAIALSYEEGPGSYVDLFTDVKGLDQAINLTSGFSSVLETDAVELPNAGGFYVAASVQNRRFSTGGPRVTGEWILQYRRDPNDPWVDLSTAVTRVFNSTDGSVGIISLTGSLPDDSEAGTYYFRLAHRQVTSGTLRLETQSAKLIAVSLGAGGGMFPVSSATGTNSSTTSTSLVAALEKQIMPRLAARFFLHSHFQLRTNALSNAPSFDLILKEDSDTIVNTSDFQSFLAASTERGSGALSGLSSLLNPDTSYDIILRHASTSGVTLTTSGPTLVGFSLTQAPPFSIISIQATQGQSSGNAKTLKEAFDAINNGTFRGDVTIQMNGSTTETASCVLNASGTGSANYSSVLIYPTAPGLSITGNLTTPSRLIDLNGADNVTIDGRVNQAGGASLIISNPEHTNSNSMTIRLINSVENNIIRYCHIRGAAPSSTAAVIFFSNSSSGSGNRNNLIEHCTFSGVGGNRPVNMIYSAGTRNRRNTLTTIRNNDFVDFLNPNTSSWGIHLAGSTQLWTLEGNSFYETEGITPNGAWEYAAIRINNTSHNNFVIRDNAIGGSAANCSGSAFSISSGTAHSFQGILINTANSNLTTIEGNIIRNMSHQSSGAATPWVGIRITAGIVDLIGNKIGNQTGTASVSVQAGSVNAFTSGIQISTTSTTVVRDNEIGGLTVQGSDSWSHGLAGILKDLISGNITIEDNQVGSPVSNSILAASGASSASTGQSLYGIWCQGTGTNSIRNNTVYNLTNNYEGTNVTLTAGLFITRGTNTIEGNTVNGITTLAASTGQYTNASLMGIGVSGTPSGVAQIIRNNEVSYLYNQHGSARTDLYGVFLNAATNATHTVSANFVHNLFLSSTNSESYINAVMLFAGRVNLINNIVHLGSEYAGAHHLYGVWDQAGTGSNLNAWFNTVLIEGSTASGTISSSFAFWNNSNATTRNVRNNLFINTRTGGTGGNHYAIGIAGNSNLTIDYNDYFVSASGILGRHVSTNITSLAAWRTATGQDANSTNADPQFKPGFGYAAFYPGLVQTGVSIAGVTLDYAGLSRSATQPHIGALEVNVFIWVGSSSTNFGTASNWSGNVVPVTGASISFDPAAQRDCLLDANRILGFIENESPRNLNLNGRRLTVRADVSFTGSGRIIGTAANSSLEYAGTNPQLIPDNLIQGNQLDVLIINNPAGVSQQVSLTVSRNLSLTTGTLFIGSNTLRLDGTISSTAGSLTGGNSSNIVFAGSGNTTLPGVELQDLTINRSATITLSGDVSVSGTLSIQNGSLSLGANTLTLSGNSPTGSGSVNAGNSSAIVVFANSNAMTLPATFFSGPVNSITISGAGGVTMPGDVTLTGALDLQAGNPSATRGILHLWDGSSERTLTMEVGAINSGPGEVTGIIRRAHAFSAGTTYTFGSRDTYVSFASGGTYPSEIRLRVRIGSTPSWKTDAIQRVYDFVRTGGSNARINITTFYRDSELNGNNENLLVFWTNGTNGQLPSGLYEWGRSHYDTTVNWVRISNFSTDNLPVSFGNLETTLAASSNKAYTWYGLLSQDWMTPRNWTQEGIPSSTHDVVIPDASTTSFSPIINGAFEVNSLTVEAGGDLTIAAGQSLSVREYYSASGTIEGNLFNQGDLSIESATVRVGISGTVTSTGSISNSNGTNGLLVESGQTGSGSLIHNNAGVQATVQRYIAGNQTFHLISTPVSGQSIASFLSDNHGIIAYNPGIQRYAMRHYIEETGGWSAFFPADQPGDLIPGVTYTIGLASPGTITFKGTLVHDSQSMELTRTGSGWNAIGNPFSSSLNANDATSSFLEQYGDQFDPEFSGLYVWDPVARVYDVINGVPGLSPDYLALAQGFIVRAKEGGGSVSFLTSMRAHNSTAFFKSTRSFSEWNILRLRIENGAGIGLLTTLAFHPDMSEGLDVGYDAGLFSDNVSLRSFTQMPVSQDGQRLMVQALPDNWQGKMIIPLGVDYPAGGQVTISISNSNLPGDVPLLLEDRELGVFTDLNLYAYTITMSPGSSPTGRFFIHVGSGITSAPLDETFDPEITVFPNPSNGAFQVSFHLDRPTAMEFRLYDLNGRLLMASTGDVYPDGRHVVPFHREGLKPGIYLFRITGFEASGRKPYLDTARKIIVHGP
jgi:hypothetical protein